MLTDDFPANGQAKAAAIGLESHVGFKGFFQHGLRVTGATVTDLYLQPFFAGLGN